MSKRSGRQTLSFKILCFKLKHKDSFGNLQPFKKNFSEILVFDHDYEGM